MADPRFALRDLVVTLFDLIFSPRVGFFVLPLITIFLIIRFLRWTVSQSRGTPDLDDIQEGFDQARQRAQDVPRRARNSFRRRFSIFLAVGLSLAALAAPITVVANDSCTTYNSQFYSSWNYTNTATFALQGITQSSNFVYAWNLDPGYEFRIRNIGGAFSFSQRQIVGGSSWLNAPINIWIGDTGQHYAVNSSAAFTYEICIRQIATEPTATLEPATPTAIADVSLDIDVGASAMLLHAVEQEGNGAMMQTILLFGLTILFFGVATFIVKLTWPD